MGSIPIARSTFVSLHEARVGACCWLGSGARRYEWLAGCRYRGTPHFVRGSVSLRFTSPRQTPDRSQDREVLLDARAHVVRSAERSVRAGASAAAKSSAAELEPGAQRRARGGRRGPWPEATEQRLGVPLSRVVTTVQKHGNTSAASAILALDEAVRDGRIRDGQLVMLQGVGGGMTWGSVLVRWG